MIEKILDKYFARKAIYLLWSKLRMLNIEMQLREDKKSYKLFIKKSKYADRYYKEFWSINFKDGLESYVSANKMDDKELQNHAMLVLND